MDELNIEMWRRHGWLVPKDFSLEEQESYIDTTCQYLLSFRVDESIADKSEFLKNELLPLIIEKLQNEFAEDENGDFECLDHVRYHLGEIFEDNFYANPCKTSNGITCKSCNNQSPIEFSLCWLCGNSLKTDSRVKSYVNIFVESTASNSVEDLIAYQHEEGPSNFREITWNDIDKQFLQEMIDLPLASFELKNDEMGDCYLNTEHFVIFARFNPKPLVELD